MILLFPHFDETTSAHVPACTLHLRCPTQAGGTDVVALGDCSLVSGYALPATAQVAGQQGAYLVGGLVE
jgi:NADH dehydrogenase FAD-containing subunit